MSCSKILERVILNRLLQHHEINYILSAAQLGFRKDLHIGDAVVLLLNNIITQFDQRKPVGGIFSDLTKAFDCVNHCILLTSYTIMILEGFVTLGLNHILQIESRRSVYYQAQMNMIRLLIGRRLLVVYIRAQFWYPCCLYYK